MALVLSKLKAEEKPLSFYFGDEFPENLVNFVYRPNEFTPGLEDQFNSASEAEIKSDAFIEIICKLVVSWDIMDVPEDEGGKPIPFIRKFVPEQNADPIQEPNYEGLKSVPSAIFSAMMTCIAEDQNPKKEQSNGSLIG